jgi:3-dehydroquinate synthase
MNSITIHTNTRDSKILIGEKFANLKQYLPPGKTIIITDDNIIRLYGNVLPTFPVITIGQGEQHKTMETLNSIFDQLINLEADRSTFILGIGGGIVCDVTGFAASIYMRGLHFGFVSTTLLSQVDASVGGKNGVNFSRYKNMIGVFSQPDFVLCDPTLLHTLDYKEFRAGFAEIVKAAVIKDDHLFSYLEQHYAGALDKQPGVIESLVYEAVKIKADVVETDEKEKGERKKLNFGHTFAHSIEHLTGMLHGEAVSVGMDLAATLSVKLGMLPERDHLRIRALLVKFGLPVSADIDPVQLFDAMKKDKKREGDSIHLILLEKIGNAIIHRITIKQLEKISYDLRQSR